MSYQFDQQKRQGREMEREIYHAFQGRYSVIPAPGWLQEQGIDFTFTDLVSRQTFKVEVKADSKAFMTRNAFIETVSVARDGQPPIDGWAYTSKADYLLYCLPNTLPGPCVYRIAFAQLREALPGWLNTCAARLIPNQDQRRGDYHTIGILVPLDELAAIAEEIITL